MRSSSIRPAVCAGSAAAAFVLGMLATTAQAQTAPIGAGEPEGLQDIVVTAEKRPTPLQRTPIAISVLDADDLANRHVQSLLDLTSGVSSLTIAPFFSRQSALIINIRGIGVLSDSNQPARDQGVGIYIDGVYQGRPQALGAALYDIENIEVLKGPQGTLFGRNTEGGAVNIVTKRPSGLFKLDVTAGAGNYGSTNVQAHLDLPSFANISLKFDGILTRHDGTVKNPLAGASDFNASDKRGFHGEALWKPSDTVTVDLSGDVGYDATTSLYQQQISPGTYILAAAARVQPTRADVSAIGGVEQPSVGKTAGVRLNLEWQAADHLQLKSIFAYRTLTQSQYDNASLVAAFNSTPTGNFTPNNAAGVPTGIPFARYSLADFRQNQVSEELQAVGTVGRVDFVAGALYYQERVQDSATAYFTSVFTNAIGSTYTVANIDPGTVALQRASYVKTTSTGVYGQATWTPGFAGDIVHLTGGARYTNDNKQGSLFIVNGVAPSPPGYPANTPIPLAYANARVDPLVNLAVDLAADVHVYGKWSTGYRSGGANSRSLTYASFAPETISMVEIGAKTEFWHHRARVNIAAYTGTYNDIQLDFSGLYQQLVNGVLVNTTRTTTNTVNAPGNGHLKGIEADVAITPARGLTFSANYAYNSVTIPPTINPFPPAVNSPVITVPIPIYQVYTPVNVVNAGVDYEMPIARAKLKLHLNADYTDGYYVSYIDSAFDPVTHLPTYLQPKGMPGS